MQPKVYARYGELHAELLSNVSRKSCAIERRIIFHRLIKLLETFPWQFRQVIDRPINLSFSGISAAGRESHVSVAGFNAEQVLGAIENLAKA